MDLRELKEHCQALAFEGKDYLDIEQSLADLVITDADREQALKAVDGYIVRYEISHQEKQKHLYKVMIGLLLVFIGSGAMMTSVGAAGIPRIFAIVFLMYGAWMARGAYAEYRRPLSADFRKGRRFKSGDMRKFYDR